MSAQRTLGLLGVCCALALHPPAVGAQLAVFPVQDLAFGQILAGVPDVVPTSDAARRAHFDVDGRGDYTLTIALPTQMTSLGGDVVPLTFTPTDGLMVRRNRQDVFDPTVPFDLRLTPNTPASVYLGGTATPAPTQAPGSYVATITVTIAPSGL